jgi:Acyl-coenzyme A:6-aminopenicillanic acid acyl-transferase
MSDFPMQQNVTASPKPGRWKRCAKLASFTTLVLIAVSAFVVKDYVRTLMSLRRVAGTNAYVMDYYLDYHIHEIRKHGIDVHNIEDSYLATLLPDIVLPVAEHLKRSYIPEQIATVGESGDHCSTVAIKSTGGDVYFGRNLDYRNDAYLILRVHDAEGVSTISVIDLAYLNLNQPDLDQTSLVRRFPLLFAPYYVMDGMNRHGVAVADMSVSQAEPPRDAKKPDIINSTLMRLILDYAHTADEAVAIIREFNIYFVECQVHLMVADSSGRFLIVEYIDGEIKITPSQQPWAVCTNHIVWQKTEAENDAACPRYRKASDAAGELKGPVDASDVMGIMRSVSVENWTMWTSVYDLTTGDLRVDYKAKANAEYRDVIGKQ